MRDEMGTELPSPKPRIARSDGSRMAGWLDMVDRRLHVLENKRPKPGGYRYSIHSIDIFEDEVTPTPDTTSSESGVMSSGVYLDVGAITFNTDTRVFKATEDGIYLVTISLTSSDAIYAELLTPEGFFPATAPVVGGAAALSIAVEVYANAGNSFTFEAGSYSDLVGRMTVDWRAPSYAAPMES